MLTNEQLFAAFKVALDMRMAISFTYTNKKGERSVRHILPQDMNISVKDGKTLISGLDLMSRDDNNKLLWKRFYIDQIDALERVVIYDKPPRGYSQRDDLADYMLEYRDQAVFMEPH